jgi:hypothetical protein
MLKKGSQKSTCQVVPFNRHKGTLHAMIRVERESALTLTTRNTEAPPASGVFYF